MTERNKKTKLPKGVWALGYTSLLTDIASEMSQSLMPLFITTTLGGSAAAIGLLDGAANFVGALARPVAGRLSDSRIGRKKLTLLGYGLAAAVRPLLAIAPSVGWVLGVRSLDRIGKGVRGAPRDAMIADMTAPDDRARAYGVRKSLDSLGAFLGPLLAIALMAAFAGNIRAVLWAAVFPGALAVVILAIFVREPRSTEHRLDLKGAAGDLSPPAKGFRSLTRRFWVVAAIGALFAAARASEAFLILNASAVGLSPVFLPAVILIMSLVYSFLALLAAPLASRVGQRGALFLSCAALVAAFALMAAGDAVPWALAAAALWGFHMGISQPVLSTMTAAAASETGRGAAFGVYGLLFSIVGFASAFGAGLIWDAYGRVAMMTVFAILSGAVTIVIPLLTPRAISAGDLRR